MKRCFKCGQSKPLNKFYRHPMMADGHLGKCKECAKADASKNHAAKKDQYKRYYAARERTESRKLWKRGALRRHRGKYPEKDRARQQLNRAVREGRIKPQFCVKCGAKAQGHHEDYSKPLEVIWLCDKHHKELHRKRETNA